MIINTEGEVIVWCDLDEEWTDCKGCIMELENCCHANSMNHIDEKEM
jgi:hypothetical protein